MFKIYYITKYKLPILDFRKLKPKLDSLTIKVRLQTIDRI